MYVLQNFTGIYEIFCKETFGVKAKNLEFGLQPYKIPETQTVRGTRKWLYHKSAQLYKKQSTWHLYLFSGVLLDAILKPPLRPVSSCTR